MRRSWQRFEVAFTGAFLTGVPLQVRISDYSRFQRDLGEELKRSGGVGWDYQSIKWRGIESYGSGGGYTSLVPLVLLQRQGEEFKRWAEGIQADRPSRERQWFHDATRGWDWTLRSICVELYDLGVGVITGIYGISVPPTVGADATRRTVEKVGHLRRDPVSGVQSPIGMSYEVLARETVAALSGAVTKCASHARQAPWLSSLLIALPDEGEGSGFAEVSEKDGSLSQAEWGRLMWMHPVFVLSGRSRASTRQLRRLARPFRPTFSKSVEYWDGVFAPGIASSVIVARDAEPCYEGPPLKLTKLMWAYYALFMEMDRGLLAMLDDDRWQTPGSLAALEEDSRRIFAIFMRVQEARARLDSALTDLAGGQLSIWKTMSEVQKFDDLVAAVEAKLQVLQGVAERRVEQAQAARAQRTSRILSGLTALTVVTVAVALIGNFIGTPADALGHIELRILIVVAAFLLATVLYREAQREIARKRERVVRAVTRRPDPGKGPPSYDPASGS